MLDTSYKTVHHRKHMTSSESVVSASRELSATQCKAARALLGWNQLELAQRANVGTSTVADFERAKRVPVSANIEAITAAFEAAGIRFVAGGVHGPDPSGQQKSMLEAGSPVRLVDATDLSQWATRNDAKAYFPELVERLILASTGNTPKRLQFPSGDSVQQPGWDGVCEQDINGNFDWLPLGVSGWELGTPGWKLALKSRRGLHKAHIGSVRSLATGNYVHVCNPSTMESWSEVGARETGRKSLERRPCSGCGRSRVVDRVIPICCLLACRSDRKVFSRSHPPFRLLVRVEALDRVAHVSRARFGRKRRRGH